MLQKSTWDFMRPIQIQLTHDLANVGEPSADSSSRLLDMNNYPVVNKAKAEKNFSVSTEYQLLNLSWLGLPRVPGYPTGTRVINYPGNFLLPAATRVPEQKQFTANVLNINAIFNRIYGIRISIYRN